MEEWWRYPELNNVILKNLTLDPDDPKLLLTLSSLSKSEQITSEVSNRLYPLIYHESKSISDLAFKAFLKNKKHYFPISYLSYSKNANCLIEHLLKLKIESLY